MIAAYVDGRARGNPGPAGFGVPIQDADGAVPDESHGVLGSTRGMDEAQAQPNGR